MRRGQANLGAAVPDPGIDRLPHRRICPASADIVNSRIRKSIAKTSSPGLTFELGLKRSAQDLARLRVREVRAELDLVRRS